MLDERLLEIMFVLATDVVITRNCILLGEETVNGGIFILRIFPIRVNVLSMGILVGEMATLTERKV